MFALLELAHADILRTFGSKEDAISALESVAATDPAAASELAILEFDEQTGRPIGDPIAVESAAGQLF